jgi:hypothetical protein
MTSRVVTSWIAEFGTSVLVKAVEITLEMATKDSVDSFPPASSQNLALRSVVLLTLENSCVAGLDR